MLKLISPRSVQSMLGSLCFTGLSSAIAAGSADGTASTKPHMLFVLVDDLGYGNVGFNRENSPTGNDTEVKTPHLDAIVADGVRLTRHYVHRFCTPSRTSLQSGRLPVHVNTGLGDPCADSTGIPQNMTGLAEHLKQQGYVTAMAGKWDAGRQLARYLAKQGDCVVLNLLVFVVLMQVWLRPRIRHTVEAMIPHSTIFRTRMTFGRRQTCRHAANLIRLSLTSGTPTKELPMSTQLATQSSSTNKSYWV